MRDLSATLLLAVDEQAEPLLMRLDPQRRAKVLMALFGLILVGAALVALVYVGGRRLRRVARRPMRPTASLEDEWYRKPLVPRESASQEPGDAD